MIFPADIRNVLLFLNRNGVEVGVIHYSDRCDVADELAALQWCAGMLMENITSRRDGAGVSVWMKFGKRRAYCEFPLRRWVSKPSECVEVIEGTAVLALWKPNSPTGMANELDSIGKKPRK